MAYNQSDSDGTDDDDLPPIHSNRSQVLRKGRPSGNGKTTSFGYIDEQIRHLELDAYTAVLRAFGAQSEVITWSKESLMSDMRKELRVADEQHREILGKVGQDETLKRLRMWRQTGEDPDMTALSHDPSPSPAVSNSRKKQKIGHAVQNFPPPPPPPLLRPAPTGTLPSPAPSGPGSLRGKQSRSKGLAPIVPSRGTPGVSSTGITPGRASVNSGRGAVPWSNHKGAGPSTDTRVDAWVGRRVRIRWPDDNTFYDAIVADYSNDSMLHCLAYDSGTTEETYEWVDLRGMDKQDVRWIEGPLVKLEGKAPPPPPVERGLGRGAKRGRGNFGGTVGRPRGSKRGRPALSHDKAALAPSPQPRPWKEGGPGEADRNGTDNRVIAVPDLTEFVLEAANLEQEDDLEKLEGFRRTAKEHEEAIKKALVQAGESSDEDDATSDDGRNHKMDSPVQSVGLEKERQSMRNTGDRHSDSEEEDDNGGRHDLVENHEVGERKGTGSDAEVHNTEDEGEADDDG